MPLPDARELFLGAMREEGSAQVQGLIVGQRIGSGGRLLQTLSRLTNLNTCEWVEYVPVYMHPRKNSHLVVDADHLLLAQQGQEAEEDSISQWAVLHWIRLCRGRLRGTCYYYKPAQTKCSTTGTALSE